MRPRIRLASALLAVLFVLAGCNALSGPGSGTGQRTPTATPAPVPTPQPELAPGVTADGVENASALGTAHERRLDGRSVTVVTDARVRFANGTDYARLTTRTLRGPDGTSLRSWRDSGLRVARRSAGAVVAETTWANGSVAVTRRVLANGSRRYRVRPDRERYLRTSTGEYVARLLAAENATVVDRTPPDDPRRVTLRVVDPPADVRGFDYVERPRNVTLRTVVTERGLVRRTVVRYEGTLAGEHVTVTTRLAYRDVGETTVDRPTWVARATDDSGAIPGDGANATADLGPPHPRPVQP